MIGMDATTGKRIAGVPYLRQRMHSAFTMRLRTSVMRALKGSRIPELIDSPMNASGVFELQVAALDVLDDDKNNGLADFKVNQVTVTSSSDGRATFTVKGKYLPDGQEITLDGIEV